MQIASSQDSQWLDSQDDRQPTHVNIPPVRGGGESVVGFHSSPAVSPIDTGLVVHGSTLAADKSAGARPKSENAAKIDSNV